MPNRSLLRAVVCTVAVWAGLCCSSTALAEEMTLINLEWRPAAQTVEVGDTVDVGLYAVVGPGEHQYFRALDMVFTWDTTYLDLLGLDATGAVDLLSSDFPYPDTLYNINEADPPQDGDGYYQAFAPLGPGVDVYDAGVLLTTFQFEALAESLGTLVDIPAYGGDPELETTVWGGGGANRDRTGTLGDAWIEIVPEPATLTLFGLGALTLLRRRR